MDSQLKQIEYLVPFSQILFDNKKRFYQIFNLTEDVLFHEIEKIKYQITLYIFNQCWNNVNIADDREIYKYIAQTYLR